MQGQSFPGFRCDGGLVHLNKPCGETQLFLLPSSTPTPSLSAPFQRDNSKRPSVVFDQQRRPCVFVTRLQRLFFIFSKLIATFSVISKQKEQH